jgi:hypothetical protein
MVSIVVYHKLTESKGDFIGEIVKGSFRLSFLKPLGQSTQLAYRIKYKEYEDSVSLKMGIRTHLSDKVKSRFMVWSKMTPRSMIVSKFLAT